jgi:hypothetical protein
MRARAGPGHVGTKRAVILALCATWAPPVLADQPLLLPSHDVDVTYRAGDARDGSVVEQRVRWLAASQTMRIDPPTPGLHVIIDYAAGRMSVVRDATRSVVEMAAPDSMAGMTAVKAGAFVRRGEASVAGRACTEWQTQDRDAHPVLVCITDDGVLLRAGSAAQARISAVSVQYAPQDPQEFRIPPDYVRRVPGAAR